MVLLNIILLLIGFILLIKGADIFVDGACSIARLLKIPTIIIGLTIVAFGTSAPELSVSISAALKESNEIALGNVVGSNIVNLLFIAGISAVIKPFCVKASMLKRDYPFSVFAAAALLALSIGDNVITRKDGCVLLALFALFLLIQMRRAFIMNPSQLDAEDEGEVKRPALRGVVFTLIGLAAVVYGGDIVVENAVIIARFAGLSETFIGLTIIAIGTSLPELVTSIVAAVKGESDLAIGNVVGSNIFNIALILGVSAVITEIPVESIIEGDIIVLTAVSAVFFIPMLVHKRLSRSVGICMIITYFAYTLHLFIR